MAQILNDDTNALPKSGLKHTVKTNGSPPICKKLLYVHGTVFFSLSVINFEV